MRRETLIILPHSRSSLLWLGLVGRACLYASDSKSTKRRSSWNLCNSSCTMATARWVLPTPGGPQKKSPLVTSGNLGRRTSALHPGLASGIASRDEIRPESNVRSAEVCARFLSASGGDPGQGNCSDALGTNRKQPEAPNRCRGTGCNLAWPGPAGFLASWTSATYSLFVTFRRFSTTSKAKPDRLLSVGKRV